MKASGLTLIALTLKDYAEQPWKNGKGSTREIAKGDGDPFPWRLSWAAVPESGPFSPYPGYDRSLTLISGGPMTLTHDGNTPRPLSRLQAHVFKGEVSTHATVDKPAEDFNLFTLRDKARGAVYPAHLKEGEEIQLSLQRSEHFFFCLEGTVEILDPNTQKTFSLTSSDTLWARRQTDKEFLNLRAKSKGSAIGLWIVVAFL